MRKITCLLFALLFLPVAVVTAGEASLLDDEGGNTKQLPSWIKIMKSDFRIKTTKPLTFHIKGTARNFPDGICLAVSLKFEGNHRILFKKVIIINNRFEIKEKFPGKICRSGNYTVEALFDPNRQAPNLIAEIRKKHNRERAENNQRADCVRMVGDQESIDYEKAEFKNYLRDTLKDLYGILESHRAKFTEFRPVKPEKKDKDKDKEEEEEPEKPDPADFKEDEWREHVNKVWEKCELIRDDYEAEYGKYVALRYPQSSERLIELCNALMRRTAADSWRVYIDWGIKPTQEDMDKAQMGRREDKYLLDHLFIPCCIQLKIPKEAIGIVPLPVESE